MPIKKLKTLPEFFQAVYEERKPFEVRWNDRDFKVGDELMLEEFDPAEDYDDTGRGHYTGSVCLRKVTYILEGGQFGVEPGYVVLGLKKI